MVERAYRGEPAAAREVLEDPRMLEQVKTPLRDGGIAAGIYRELQQQADHVATELQAGNAGRQRLLAEAALSPRLREQLAALPARALRDPEAATRVSELLRESLMAQAPARVTETTEHTLARIRLGLQGYAGQLATQVHDGIKMAFAAAIASMLAKALWIVALGVLIILFIPELPLRSRGAVSEAVQA